MINLLNEMIFSRLSFRVVAVKGVSKVIVFVILKVILIPF